MTALLLICGTAVQAAGDRSSVASDPAAQLSSDLRGHRFHDAMSELERVRVELNGASGNAWEKAYERTLKLTASMGQKEWPAILADPAIPLPFKHGLVDRIARAAERDAQGKTARGVRTKERSRRPGDHKAPEEFDASGRLRDALEQRRFRLALRLLRQVEVELKDVGEGAWGYEYSHAMDLVVTWGREQWAPILRHPKIPFGVKQDLVDAIAESGKETKAEHDSDVVRWAHRYRGSPRLAGILIQQVPDSREQESAYADGHPAMILYVFRDGRVNQVEFRPDGRITTDWWWHAKPDDPVWAQLRDIQVGLDDLNSGD